MEKTIGDNLKRLRLRNNLSLAKAGNLLGLSAPGLLKYERNIIEPTLERLNDFARVYHTTLDELIDLGKSNEVKYTNLKYKNNTSQNEIEKIKLIIKHKIDNYFELLDLSNIKLQNKFGVHIINSEEEAESLATKLRIFFTIPIDAPINNLIYLLETNNMIIMTISKKEKVPNFLGFYENVNNIPVIIVPEEGNGYDQRFIIAKYLGELLMVSNNKIDGLSNRFAESLLIPKQSLLNEFGNKRNTIDFREIKIFSNIYKVSYKNIVKRLLFYHIITPSNAKYTNIFINKNNIKEQTYYEEANKYNQMLYKLYGTGYIKDLHKYE